MTFMYVNRYRMIRYDTQLNDTNIHVPTAGCVGPHHGTDETICDERGFQRLRLEPLVQYFAARRCHQLIEAQHIRAQRSTWEEQVR